MQMLVKRGRVLNHAIQLHVGPTARKSASKFAAAYDRREIPFRIRHSGSGSNALQVARKSMFQCEHFQYPNSVCPCFSVGCASWRYNQLRSSLGKITKNFVAWTCTKHRLCGDLANRALAGVRGRRTVRKPTPVHIYGNNGIPTNAGDRIGSPENTSVLARYACRFDGRARVPDTPISRRQHASGHKGVVEALRRGLMIKNEGVTMAVLRAVVQLSAAVREHLTPYYKFLVTQVPYSPHDKHKRTTTIPIQSADLQARTRSKIYTRGGYDSAGQVTGAAHCCVPFVTLLLATDSGAQRWTRRLQAN